MEKDQIRGNSWNCECGQMCGIRHSITEEMLKVIQRPELGMRYNTVAYDCPNLKAIVGSSIGAIDGFVLFESPIRYKHTKPKKSKKSFLDGYRRMEDR